MSALLRREATPRLPRRRLLVRRLSRRHPAFGPSWMVSREQAAQLEPGPLPACARRTSPVWRWSAVRWVLRTPRALNPTETASPGVLLPIRDRRRPWRPDSPSSSRPTGASALSSESPSRLRARERLRHAVRGLGRRRRRHRRRLRNAGLRCGWPGPRATLLHVWHPREGGCAPTLRSSGRRKRTGHRCDDRTARARRRTREASGECVTCWRVELVRETR